MGFGTGILYFAGLVIQTIGIQTTNAGKAGFITGLSAVVVPFIDWFRFKKPLDKRIWIAVVFSVVGMSFLLLEGETGIIIGDIIVLISIFCWAFYIIFNDKNVRLVDIYSYSMIQIFVICVSSFIFSLLFREQYDLTSYSLPFWVIMVYMGIGVMTLSILFQNWAQQYQGPTQTAIIFTLEPVFAALFGFIIGNEFMSLFGWLGSGLVFFAILITIIKSKKNNEIDDTNTKNFES